MTLKMTVLKVLFVLPFWEKNNNDITG
jgi:hypothetical protein